MVDRQPRQVIPLRGGDYVTAGEVLSRAFLDDPLWVALMPDAEFRRTGLARMFTGLAKVTVAAGGAAETTPGLEAVAFWLPPGRDLGLWATVRSGMSLARFALLLPAPDRRRMLAVLEQLDRQRKLLVPEPHWYLSAVGVEPGHQGAGFGSALVRLGLSRADRDHSPVYLETETSGNVAFYEHLGFDVIEETVATGLDVPMWLMIRKPGTSSN